MARYNENLERKVTMTEDDERGSLVDIRPIWLPEQTAGENNKVMDRGLHCSWWSVQNNNEFKGTRVRVNKLFVNRSCGKACYAAVHIIMRKGIPQCLKLHLCMLWSICVAWQKPPYRRFLVANILVYDFTVPTGLHRSFVSHK